MSIARHAGQGFLVPGLHTEHEAKVNKFMLTCRAKCLKPGVYKFSVRQKDMVLGGWGPI